MTTLELNIMTPSQFALAIEGIVKEKSIGYLDAAMWYVDRNNMEVEAAASLIKSSQILKSKIKFRKSKLR